MTSFLGALKTHNLNNFVHPSILVHELSEPTLSPPESKGVLQALFIFFMEIIHNIYGVSNHTAILSLAEGLFWIPLAVFIIFVEVAVLGCQDMRTLKVIRALLTEPIGLSGVAFEALIGTESAAIVDYLEDVGVARHAINLMVGAQ